MRIARVPVIHLLSTLLSATSGQFVLASSQFTMASESAQSILQKTPDNHGDIGSLRIEPWKLELSSDWDVLGPCPIHAREQHFLSPAFPLVNLSNPIDFTKHWPSSYADNGSVTWSKARSSSSGNLKVSFPDIRWSTLRATEGWAALQHHAVLKTTITLHPPSLGSPISFPSTFSVQAPVPNLLFTLSQGSFFTVVPQPSASTSTPENQTSYVPEWYAGNIYDMQRGTPQSVTLPVPPSLDRPTVYDVFVSGDYEIRLFGDPLAQRSPHPILDITLTVSPSSSISADPSRSSQPVERVETHDVMPDFVDGWAFGNAVGVGLRSVEGWWNVVTVEVLGSSKGGESDAVQTDLKDVFDLNSLYNVSTHSSQTSPQTSAHPTRLAPSQTRILPLTLTQLRSLPIFVESISLKIILKSATSTDKTSLVVELPVNHITDKDIAEWKVSQIKASYFYTNSMPSNFGVLPPTEKTPEGQVGPSPYVLALHGAGVDVIDMPFWAEGVPRQKFSWVVLPTGRTAWGLDWRGPSATDAWSSVDTLHQILSFGGFSQIATSSARSPVWNNWTAPYRNIQNNEESKVVGYNGDGAPGIVVIGHSNGGQGTWYLISRWPDRVLGAVPAAGYIKAQSYVSLGNSRSAHFIDPSLRAILDTSFTPDDNDLFLSNLVDTPILVVHGGADDNVPTWHSRELVSILKTWNPLANVSYREVAGQPHWFPTVFRNDQVEGFLDSLLLPDSSLSSPNTAELDDSFTLTVATPRESGSMHGWRVLTLETPGRLGRLTVHREGVQLHVKTANIRTFTLDISRFRPQTDFQQDIYINRIRYELPLLPSDLSLDTILVENVDDSRRWVLNQISSSFIPVLLQPPSRLASILNSPGPLTLVVPTLIIPSRALSVATRLARDLDLYHKLDTEVISDSEAHARLVDGTLGKGNIVFIGLTGEGEFATRVLREGNTPFAMEDNVEPVLTLNGEAVEGPSQAVLFLHPHPKVSEASILFMLGTDISGLERASRLFPIRTGITLPSWLIVGPEADKVGAAGVHGAGVWGAGWAWEDAASWHH